MTPDRFQTVSWPVACAAALLLVSGCLLPPDRPCEEVPPGQAGSCSDGDDDTSDGVSDDDDTHAADDDTASASDDDFQPDDDDSQPADDDTSADTCAGDGQPVHEGCDTISWEGCCDGESLYWCENGWVCVMDCSENPSCGWDSKQSFYNCGTGGDAAPGNDPPLDCN